MNETTEMIKEEIPTAVCDRLHSLAGLSVGADYDLTLRLTDKTGKRSSECLHHFNGSSSHDLINLLCIGGIVAAGVTAALCAVHMVCCCACHRR